jgi:hypothetical protein
LEAKIRARVDPPALYFSSVEFELTSITLLCWLHESIGRDQSKVAAIGMRTE